MQEGMRKMKWKWSFTQEKTYRGENLRNSQQRIGYGCASYENKRKFLQQNINVLCIEFLKECMAKLIVWVEAMKKRRRSMHG